MLSSSINIDVLMFKKTLCLVFLFLFSLNSYSYKFDTIVTFGDSLSDNGNLYQFIGHLIPSSPPYYEGRFSNGPVWIENLYQTYFTNTKPENFLDFAVGGAGAVLSYKENLPYSLDAELNNYLYLHNFANKNKTLFIVWIGGNNYLNGPSNVDDITTSVVDAIGNNLKALVERGGVMFLVVNLPDLGKTPEAARSNSQELLTKLTLMHNQKLLDKFNALKEEYPNVSWTYFDVYSMLNQVMDSPQQYGISNITQPCYTGGFYGSSVTAETTNNPIQLNNYLTQQAQKNEVNLDEKTRQAILENPALREALSMSYQNQLQPRLAADKESCEGYLFWDHVHPTATIHQLIAQNAKSILDEAGLEPMK
ncbi:lysophospholipase A [Legionella nautarum]|uniref:Lysophospholipase A n=2 Tax=Legionella nautarum TaxID=45070 RepID=A0A0W0WLB3_9GAMM|nr:lysophospholipase A [Legionella nautarum]